MLLLLLQGTARKQEGLRSPPLLWQKPPVMCTQATSTW